MHYLMNSGDSVQFLSVGNDTGAPMMDKKRLLRDMESYPIYHWKPFHFDIMSGCRQCRHQTSRTRNKHPLKACDNVDVVSPQLLS